MTRPFTVIIKNPSDFIGQGIGESEANTRSILASAVGKVLIIDEVSRVHNYTSALLSRAE